MRDIPWLDCKLRTKSQSFFISHMKNISWIPKQIEKWQISVKELCSRISDRKMKHNKQHTNLYFLYLKKKNFHIKRSVVWVGHRFDMENIDLLKNMDLLKNIDETKTHIENSE